MAPWLLLHFFLLTLYNKYIYDALQQDREQVTQAYFEISTFLTHPV